MKDVIYHVNFNSQDEIILLAANNFDSDWMEASKKMLFELCPTTQRNISHKGAQKDANNIKSCLKVLNECGDNVPRFVSHYLDVMWLLPTWTYAKVEQLHNEVSAMKHVLHRQTETSEGLRAHWGLPTKIKHRQVCGGTEESWQNYCGHWRCRRHQDDNN